MDVYRLDNQKTRLIGAIDPSLALVGRDESVALFCWELEDRVADGFESSITPKTPVIFDSMILEGDWGEQAEQFRERFKMHKNGHHLKHGDTVIVDQSGIGQGITQYNLGAGYTQKIIISGGRDADSINSRGSNIVSRNLLLRKLRSAINKGSLKIHEDTPHVTEITTQLKKMKLEVGSDGNIKYISARGNAVDDWTLACSYVVHGIESKKYVVAVPWRGVMV
jgi:hypothetical protein